MSRNLWHIVWAGQPGRRVHGWHAVTSSVPFPDQHFLSRPSPFLGQSTTSSLLACLLACLGQRAAKIIWKLEFLTCSSRAPHSHITFALIMDTRQKTVMQNWHDLLVQFKNFMTFCLTLADSCTDTHFLYPSILVFRLSSTMLLNNLFLPSNSWIQEPPCSYKIKKIWT